MSQSVRPGAPFGRYVIEKRLGSGAMGVVWRARDTVLNRPVALKLLAESLAEDEEFRARFLREASTLARLDSPHIISVFDHGEVDGHLYLVNQLVTGGDLRERLDREGPLTGPEALSLVAQLADALADAHASGVVHRDVKPSNVLLRGERAERGPAHDRSELFGYLCDFGIAQTGDDGGTRSGMVLGSWGYLAPERARGVPASASSDVYSLGCVLWAALTGRAPFDGTEVQVAMAHQSDPVPQLTVDGSPLVDGLNRVIARAMAKDPAARHASAADLGTDLRRVEVDAARRRLIEPTVIRPVTATATPAPPAPGPPPHRRSTMLLAVAIVAVLVVAGTVVALMLTRGSHPAAPAANRTTPSSTPTRASSTPAAVRCWNGVTAASRTACVAVRGESGMRWLFPSYARSSGCRPDDLYAGKVRATRCIVRLADGADARLVYSEWSTTAAALSHYRGKYGAPSGRAGGIETWSVSYVAASKNWQTSRYVEGLPYSVTAVSTTRADVEAVARLIEIRSAAERQGLR